MNEELGLAVIKNEFAVPQAKIDYIVLRLPRDLDEEAELRAFIGVLGSAVSRTELPRKIADRNRFTIHDPTVFELQRLIANYPELQILALEIAIDFYLKDNSNDPARLSWLREWLVHRLYPQKHECMRERGWRKYFDPETNAIYRDAMRSKGGNTVYWGTPAGHEQVRLYTKTGTWVDGRWQSIESQCVRVEVTLYRGGCQNAGVHRLALLPDFAKNLRVYVGKFFCVGAGIVQAAPKRRSRSKDLMKRATDDALERVIQHDLNNAWEKYGARWAITTGKKVKPDSEANRWIGLGLKKLREKLLQLKLPAAAAEKVAEWKVEYDTKSAIRSDLGKVEVSL